MDLSYNYHHIEVMQNLDCLCSHFTHNVNRTDTIKFIFNIEYQFSYTKMDTTYPFSCFKLIQRRTIVLIDFHVISPAIHELDT